jgi:uncharacterized protein
MLSPDRFRGGFGTVAPTEPGGRHLMAAGRVIAVGMVVFLLWGLFDARSLEKSAEASPKGVRRTAALAVLKPLFAVSRVIQTDRVGSAVERLFGRNPDRPGGSASAVGPPPPVHPSPTPSGGTSPPPGGGLSPLRSPTPQDPFRILVVGDSFAADLGLGLGRTLDQSRYSIAIDGRPSTGLTRPDYFDWGAQFPTDLARYRPELVVVMIGGNDFQNLFLDGRFISYFRSAEAWQYLYALRVDRVMNEAVAAGARVVWVGLPVVGSSKGLSQAVRRFDGIFEQEAVSRPSVMYVDDWQLFTNASGQYSAYIRTPNGDIQLMRSPDKVHLTLTGNEYLARHVVSILRRQWGLKT